MGKHSTRGHVRQGESPHCSAGSRRAHASLRPPGRARRRGRQGRRRPRAGQACGGHSGADTQRPRRPAPRLRADGPPGRGDCAERARGAGRRRARGDKLPRPLGREGKQDSLGPPYSDRGLAVQLLHGAAPPPPGSRAAAQPRHSGLPLGAGGERGPRAGARRTACGPTAPARPRAPRCGTPRESLLPGRDHTLGRTECGAARPQSDPPAGAGAAADGPASDGAEAPGAGGSAGALGGPGRAVCAESRRRPPARPALAFLAPSGSAG